MGWAWPDLLLQPQECDGIWTCSGSLRSSLPADEQKAPCAMPGRCPSGFSPSCWGSYLDRSRPRALERLLPPPTPQEGQGPPHPQARRGLFQLRCAAVLVASPPLPLPSSAVEHLLHIVLDVFMEKVSFLPQSSPSRVRLLFPYHPCRN